ncbi:MAG: hypothetical protein JNL87_20315 [Burkholderiaceae bacterium]|nr:hypothetical protein [Burkholderiaceae bacterium]
MARRPPYDDIHAQHARLTAWLRCNGRTSCAALGLACDVPSVTKRVCELIAEGWPIQRARGYVPTRSGGRRRATFYELTGPHPQGDLFQTLDA